MLLVDGQGSELHGILCFSCGRGGDAADFLVLFCLHVIVLEGAEIAGMGVC